MQKTIYLLSFSILLGHIVMCPMGKKYNHPNSLKQQCHTYKKPDLRKRHLNRTAKHLEHISNHCRKKQPHFFSPIFSNRQRALFVGLTLMLLMPTVTAAAPNNNGIFTVPYQPGRGGNIDETFGPCEPLPNNATLCCNIGGNYTVTCCTYPNSHRISFDPSGIVGDQEKPAHFDIKAELRKAEKTCAITPETRHIADETTAFLNAKRYNTTVQDQSQSLISSPLTNQQTNSLPLSIELLNGSKISCRAPLMPIKSNDLPIFTSLIQKLVEKFRIPRYDYPSLTFFNDEMCDPQIKSQVGWTFTGIIPHLFSPHEIELMASFLQSFSDKELTAVMAHEIHHQAQHHNFRKRTGNNHEAEADLASVLATNSPCHASWLSKIRSIHHRSFPQITKENAEQRLAACKDDPHPCDTHRISFITLMHYHYKKARQQLLDSIDY